jgi:hypothetical protein
MRTKILFFCGIVLTICLLLLLSRKPQTKAEPPEVKETATNQPVTNEPVPSEKITARQNQTSSQPLSAIIAEAVHRGTPEGSNEMNQRALAHWQAPIDFYGKVVDENTNPVVDATVNFHWVEEPTEKGNRNTNTQSDSEGLFSLHDARGPSLSVSVSKEGYYSRRGGAQYGIFASDGFSPDPLKPVIFLLRKKGQSVELITSQNGIRPSLAIRIPKDGTPVRVDFFQKQVSATGQLEISQNKPPWQGATNWSFSLSIPDGGLIENQDEFQFQAPDTGYQPTVKYNFAKAEPDWTTHVSKQFYIVFDQPRKYGWLRFESDISQETVFVTYAINPTGSRNLEPQ